jgi:ABC-type antimicrobial peptide transport system permease subunit
VALLTAYTFRNAFKRRLTSVLTVIGVALVVFVFSAVLMLSHGLGKTMVDSGYDDNVVAIRRASVTEVSSIIPRQMGNIVKTDPAIAADSSGVPQIAGEISVLISQPKRSDGEPSNVAVRGVSEMSMKIRPDIRLAEGRMYREGTLEVIAGAKTSRTFQGCGIGETVRFASRDWTVVGIFEANGGATESEVWGSYDQLCDAFLRPIYSSFTARLASPDLYDEMKERLENDPRLTVELHREKQYYADQTYFTRTFINILGTVISIIFSLGAIVGAMITTYGAVANRTTEIGTLRALGFSRFTVLSSFLVESVMISLIGGVFGVVAAHFLRFVEVSTTNWDTFAELAFTFETSWFIVIAALLFAIVMGLVGGFLPAVRASRMRIVNALRAR